MKLGLLILAQPRIIIECRFWLKMAHLFFILVSFPGWTKVGQVVPWSHRLASH